MELQKQPVGKCRMDNPGRSPESNRLAVDVDARLTNKRTRTIIKQQLKTSDKNGAAEKNNKMSLATMLASADRLSKNLERKMTKPMSKKESNVNGNHKPIKKSSMTDDATVARRSVFEVPLTSEPSLKHQCICENTIITNLTPSKKDVAVQTELHSDTRKSLKNCVSFKEFVKNLNKFLRLKKNTTNPLKEYRNDLSALRIIATAGNNHWKFINNFIWFLIGVFTTCVGNYGWNYIRCIKNYPLLLE